MDRESRIMIRIPLFIPKKDNPSHSKIKIIIPNPSNSPCGPTCIFNNASVMRYWFAKNPTLPSPLNCSPCTTSTSTIQSERRFIVEGEGQRAGLVELVEIDHVHRRAEFQIIIAPEYQGRGLATHATRLAMEYGFKVLNLYKLYLIVDTENKKAVRIYTQLGFQTEGELKDEFFVNGEYRSVLRMCLFQHDYLGKHPPVQAPLTETTVY